MTKKQKETLALLAREILRTKRMILKLAPALILFALPALAQAPGHTFTLNHDPMLTVPYNNGQYGQSFYTWTLTSFDGAPATGSEVQHLASYLGTPETFDFTFPIATLVGCTEGLPQTSFVYSAVNRRSEVTVETFSCLDSSTLLWTVQTTTTTLQYRSWVRFKYMWFDFQSGQPAITGIVSMNTGVITGAIQGSVTEAP